MKTFWIDRIAGRAARGFGVLGAGRLACGTGEAEGETSSRRILRAVQRRPAAIRRLSKVIRTDGGPTTRYSFPFWGGQRRSMVVRQGRRPEAIEVQGRNSYQIEETSWLDR